MEGAQLLDEALAAGALVESVYLAANAADGQAAVDLARDRGARIFTLADGVLERVADTVTPQPVLAVVAIGAVPLAGLEGGDPIVVCAGVRDPGNAGAVLRSARAVGAGGVIFCASAVDPYNPKTVRASAGAVFRVPVVADADLELAPVADRLAAWGLCRLAAVVEGGRDYAEVDLTRPLALVVGNEARGLPDADLTLVDELVTIPMAGGAESLNVGVAAAVICFEAARQRRVAARP